jgi:RNA polymerase sigma factor (sigma-70 family)
MQQHDGLVHAFLRRQGGGAISYEEALQAGRIGLWHAIQGYDPTRGTAFSTYAWVAICRQVHRRVQELRRDTAIWLPEMPAAWAVPDPAEDVERELTEGLLHDLVGQLPPRLH